MPPNPQRKLPLHVTRPADRTLRGRPRGTLTEQGAVTECEHRGYRRDRADPNACNQASEEAWRNQFPGATPPLGANQGISTTDHPSSGVPERQPVLR